MIIMGIAQGLVLLLPICTVNFIYGSNIQVIV